MNKRRFSLGSLLLIALCAAASCAEGAPAFSGESKVDAGPVSPMPSCGNGVVDNGELCDCNGLTTGTCRVMDPTQTCQSLMNDTEGMLLCDAATCMFNVSMCRSTMPDAGGGGAGG